MKTQQKILTGILILFFQVVYAQKNDEWNRKPYGNFWYDWTIDINAGFTSYFGDLSQYDLKPVKKLAYESKPAFGVKLTKNIHRNFGISGQFIYGGFKNDNIITLQFETKIIEYNVQASADLLHLFAPNHKPNIKWKGYAGFGQFLFNTNSYGDLETLSQQKTYQSTVPEFVYFFGSTVYLPVSETVWLTADLSIRQAQNDNLDLYLSAPDFDYYSYLAIGVSISINNLRKPFYKTPDCDAYNALK